MWKWMALAAGGMLGTFARYGLTRITHKFLGTNFPYGTFAVNLLGCFLIGLFAVLHEEKFAFMSPQGRFLLMVGFCGAFTTFSTFMLETADLVQSGNTLYALMNILASVLVGFALFRIGMWAGQAIS